MSIQYTSVQTASRWRQADPTVCTSASPVMIYTALDSRESGRARKAVVAPTQSWMTAPVGQNLHSE